MGTTAPTILTFSPTDAVTGVLVNSNIVLTFSDAIQMGTGTIAIHSGSALGPIVESFRPYNYAISIVGNTLTIDPSDLSYNTHYYVTIDSGFVKDLAGNSYVGSTTYDFSTGPKGTSSLEIIHLDPTVLNLTYNYDFSGIPEFTGYYDPIWQLREQIYDANDNLIYSNSEVYQGHL